MSEDVAPIPPTEDYWESDDQLHPTVGPDMAGLDSVEAADPETTRRVLEAIGSPKKVPEPTGEIDTPRPIRADGTSGELPMMEIPGFGSEYADCGKPMPMACSGCGHTAEVGRTCRRSTCPRCGAAWVRDRAVNLCARLGATRAVRDANRDDHQRYHHLAWMPPKDWRLEAEDVLERSLQVIRDIMYALDLEGYVFYHPWSGENSDEDGDDRGKWKDRLFSDREWKGDVREELEFRPHFHVVCVGHKVPGQDFTAEIYDRTGWILKRITKSEENAVSIYNDEDLAKVVTYCLSHSAIDREKASDGSAQRTYRRYGPVITDSDVSVGEATREHHDRLVRQAATTTLGIPLKDQFCFAETIGNTGMDEYDAVRAAITAQAASNSDGGPDDMGSSSGSSSDSSNDATATPDAASPVAMDGPLNTPAKKAAENPSLDLEEPSECEGQMVHLCDARHLLDDDDWLEQADHADELQTTLDDWADRMDELIRFGPFNSG